VNRIDQETEEEARAHKGCRAIQEEEESHLNSFHHLRRLTAYSYEKSLKKILLIHFTGLGDKRI
jgi:hypothetical protein